MSDREDCNIGKHSTVSLVESCTDGGVFIANNRKCWMCAIPVSSFDTYFI